MSKSSPRASLNSQNKYAKRKRHSHEECDIIGELMGNYGKYQFYMTFFLSLFQIPNTFHISSPVYQAGDKQFWCKRPTHLNHIDPGLWRNYSGSADNCNILLYNWTEITEETLTYGHRPDTSKHVKCTAWEYDPDDHLGNTWTSEWNLVCDMEYMKSVGEMFFLVGVATGGLISGYLSDKFGRKTMLFISVVFQTIFGFALYYPTNSFRASFRLLLLLRTLLGIASVAVTYAGLILAIEFVDGKWRTIAGMYNLFPLPISYMLISGIAYLTQDYRLLQICIALPGIFLCFLYFVIPESPRWLLVKGRTAEVATIIRHACIVNKRDVPDNIEKLLRPPSKQSDTGGGCFSLFASRYLRLITFCFLCIWFTMNLVYYGLILNMNSFGGNVYLNSALAGLVEIPAIALAMFIIMRVGKKWILCSTMFFAGIACLCIAVCEGRHLAQWVKTLLLMIGKFTISAGNTVMPVYTAELYPTAIRNAGVGACNVAAGVALIIVPYLSLLTKIESYYLMGLLAAAGFAGSFVVVFLPESMEHQLASQHPPDELNDEGETADII